jgi:hypothetical protein
VFEILSDARDVIPEMKPLERTSKRLDYILSTVSTALQKSFGKDSSPEDVDEDGNGILQVYFPVQSVYVRLNNAGGLLLLGFVFDYSQPSTNSIYTLVDTCVSQNVLYDQPNFWGMQGFSLCV